MPNCSIQIKSAEHGIYGPAAGISGSIAAAQAGFYFLDREKCVQGLIIGDLRAGFQRTIKVAPKCINCLNKK